MAKRVTEPECTCYEPPQQGCPIHSLPPDEQKAWRDVYAKQCEDDAAMPDPTIIEEWHRAAAEEIFNEFATYWPPQQVSYQATKAAAIIARHREQREKRLVDVLDAHDAILHLQSTCVVCGCALYPPTNPPHCDGCLPDDEHEFEWRGAMCDHHKILDDSRQALTEAGYDQ